METLVGLVFGIGLLYWVGVFCNWLIDSIDIEWQYTWKPWLGEHKHALGWGLLLVIEAAVLLRLVLEVA